VTIAPLDLRELFAQPWVGQAVLWRPWWLRWLPVPESFGFRSEIVDPGEGAWTVRDTSTYPDGSTHVREMHCERLAPSRLRLTAPDMPGGAEVVTTPGGFRFSPYTLRTTVVGPLRVSLRFRDVVRLEPDGTMVDEIEMRLARILVGTVTMRLRRHPGAEC
jgi:hypothetical protein